MKIKSAFLIQLIGAGCIGWLTGGANYTIYEAMAWILGWLVACMVLRMVGDE